MVCAGSVITFTSAITVHWRIGIARGSAGGGGKNTKHICSVCGLNILLVRALCTRIYRFQTKELRNVLRMRLNFLGRGLI